MKYSIKLTTFTAEKSPEALISAALGFNNELSHGTVIDLFSGGARHKNGVFTSKKVAKTVADTINKRGAFGGFGNMTVTATVVAL